MKKLEIVKQKKIENIKRYFYYMLTMTSVHTAHLKGYF